MPDPLLDEPTEGLPGYLMEPALQWMREVVPDRVHGGYRDGALRRLQLRFKLPEPLDFSRSARGSALHDLTERMTASEEFALDVLDYVLHHIKEFVSSSQGPRGPRLIAGNLQVILVVGGSAWEVAAIDADNNVFGLSRRAVGPVLEVIAAIPSSTRAHQHLVAAWNHLSGRSPDPTGAYREAVRGVEAVAKPVLLPANDRATLGTMIAAMRDKPEKWESTLMPVEDVRRMMESVWTNQLDRHGTDDETVPLNVTQEQADVAVHLGISLVRLFAGGYVRPAGTPDGVDA